MRVYVNWRDEDILSVKQYEDLLEEKVNELKADTDAFNEWIDRNYNASNLFWDDTRIAREIITEEWATHCWDEVTYDLSKDYDEYDIEED